MYKRFKKWIKNLKYIAPKARRNVIRYKLLACILSVLYFIPFLIGTILYFIFALALCIIVPYLTWDKELIFGNSLIQLEAARGLHPLGWRGIAANPLFFCKYT